MRRRSSWFLGLLFTVSVLGSCASDASRPAAADAPSLNDSYRLALSYLTLAGE